MAGRRVPGTESLKVTDTPPSALTPCTRPLPSSTTAGPGQRVPASTTSAAGPGRRRDPPGRREPVEQDVEQVEQHGQDDHAEDPAEHQVDRDRAADPGQAGEDVVAQPWSADVGADRGDPQGEQGRDPHAGQDHRPGQRQLDAEQPQPPSQARLVPWIGVLHRTSHHFYYHLSSTREQQQPASRKHVASVTYSSE